MFHEEISLFDDMEHHLREEVVNIDNNVDGNNTVDMVNNPPHYNRDGAIECIEEMKLVFGLQKTAYFCLLNCWKYRYRSGSKNNAEEDMRKSDWYLRKYRELQDQVAYEKHLSLKG